MTSKEIKALRIDDQGRSKMFRLANRIIGLTIFSIFLMLFAVIADNLFWAGYMYLTSAPL